jgi:hypothetical protein
MRKLLPVLLVLSAVLAAVEPDPVLPPVVYVAHETGTDIDPDDRTVFLPYERFLALLAATRAGGDSPTESAVPPVPAVLESWTARIQVAGDAADVRIEGTAENLSEGWASLSWPGSLGFSRFSSPVEGVSLERRGERLLLHLPQRGTVPFSAESVAAVSTDDQGRRRLALTVPPAGSGALEIRLPDPDAQVALSPALPATTLRDDDGLTLRVLVNGQPKIDLSWKGKVVEQDGPPLLLSTAVITAAVEERAIHWRHQVDVDILRNATDRLAIRLPADAQVLSVQAQDLAGWDVAEGLLSLRFTKALQAQTRLVVETERALDLLARGASRDLVIDWPALVDASRRTGHLALVEGEGTRLQVQRAHGVSQVNPATSGVADAVAAYRFLATPEPITVQQQLLAPELRGQLHQWVRLGVDEDRIQVVLDATVRGAGRFDLALTAPASWRLLDVHGDGIDDVRSTEPAAGVQEHRITLRNKLLGRSRPGAAGAARRCGATARLLAGQPAGILVAGFHRPQWPGGDATGKPQRPLRGGGHAS